MPCWRSRTHLLVALVLTGPLSMSSSNPRMKRMSWVWSGCHAGRVLSYSVGQHSARCDACISHSFQHQSSASVCVFLTLALLSCELLLSLLCVFLFCLRLTSFGWHFTRRMGALHRAVLCFYSSCVSKEVYDGSHPRPLPVSGWFFPGPG